MVMKNSLVYPLLFAAILSLSSCKEECTLNCQNGATCVQNDPTYGSNNAGYRCECSTGFEGSTCGVKTLDKLIGNFQGGGFCSGNQNLIFAVTEVSASDGRNFNIGPIEANYYTKIDTVISNSSYTKYKFLVGQQTASIDTAGNGAAISLSLSGSGYFLGDSSMILNLKFPKVGGGNTLCSSTYTKQ